MTAGVAKREAASEARHLRTPEAIRERAEAIHGLAVSGKSCWSVDEGRLAGVVARVIAETRSAYPDVRAIPYHGRWRHFSAGGVDRTRRFEEGIAAFSREDRLAARFELAITSVLLDAGAGPSWSFREPGGLSYARSEGLAVASYHLFTNGVLSDDPRRTPLHADAGALERLDGSSLGRAFQISEDNPLVGIDGRVTLLNRLGRAVRETPRYFGDRAPRLGGLGIFLLENAHGGAVRARDVLDAVLDSLGSIWPGRETLGGVPLGDVWRHPAVGWVPFHKLSQWLTYSLIEPIEAEGVKVEGVDELTGLAEYRNGGLFVDGGVLVAKDEGALAAEHDVSSNLVVEWRALTVALLDRVAEGMRRALGLSSAELPLAKVLEGGTWRTGRLLAAESRAGGGPPLCVRSDGTVF